jgi:hypothetical protein
MAGRLAAGRRQAGRQIGCVRARQKGELRLPNVRPTQCNAGCTCTDRAVSGLGACSPPQSKCNHGTHTQVAIKAEESSARAMARTKKADAARAGEAARVRDLESRGHERAAAAATRTAEADELRRLRSAEARHRAEYISMHADQAAQRDEVRVGFEAWFGGFGSPHESLLTHTSVPNAGRARARAPEAAREGRARGRDPGAARGADRAHVGRAPGDGRNRGRCARQP